MCPLWQRGSTFVEEDLRACFQPRWIGRAVACAGIEGAVSFPFGFEGGEWWNRPTNTGLVHQRNHVELIASSGNVCLRNLNPTCTRLLEGVALMRHGERHFFSLSPFQNMYTAEKRRMEWWCFPRDCIDRSRVDFSDNCGHGGLRRLWWLSFCTFRCFGVNRKRGRRGRGNRITRAVGEKDEKVGKTCCVYRIYIPFFFLSFDVTMCFFLNIIKGRERVLIKLQVINYRCKVSRFICSNFYRGTKVFLFFAGNKEFWFVHESNELNFILYVILFSKVYFKTTKEFTTSRNHENFSHLYINNYMTNRSVIRQRNNKLTRIVESALKHKSLDRSNGW